MQLADVQRREGFHSCGACVTAAWPQGSHGPVPGSAGGALAASTRSRRSRLGRRRWMARPDRATWDLGEPAGGHRCSPAPLCERRAARASTPCEAIRPASECVSGPVPPLASLPALACSRDLLRAVPQLQLPALPRRVRGQRAQVAPRAQVRSSAEQPGRWPGRGGGLALRRPRGGSGRRWADAQPGGRPPSALPGTRPRPAQPPPCCAVRARRFTLLPEWAAYRQRYRAILLPDDDLVMDTCTVNQVFSVLRVSGHLSVPCWVPLGATGGCWVQLTSALPGPRAAAALLVRACPPAFRASPLPMGAPCLLPASPSLPRRRTTS